MPTYEYECKKCGLVFEHFQSMNDEPLKKCIHPEGCKHPKSPGEVTRLISTGAGLIFKGSGFYTTDYRSKEYHESARKDNITSTTPSTTGDSGKTSTEKPKSKGGSSSGKSSGTKK